jgi:cell division protein FtsZ
MAQVLQHNQEIREVTMADNNNPLPESNAQPILKVLGLGGGGSNAVNRMIELGLQGVDFVVANTDHQALETSYAATKIQLGPKLTRGLGAGGDPEVGMKAAMESCEEIRAALEGADMVFLTAGMGGGTGTGSIAVAGEIAKSVGAVTIAIVTTPFSFEMGRRQKNAVDGLAALRPNTDTLIAIPNDRLLYVAPKNLPLEVAFRLADDVLRQAVQGIAELVTEPGVINVDFAHIRQMMKLGGGALMAIGQGDGDKKAMSAIHQALNHPLLESVSLNQAAGIIANFTGGQDLTLYDVGEALHHIQLEAGGDVDVVMGFNNDNRLGDRAQVILVITGLGAPSMEDVIGKEAERPFVVQPSAVAHQISPDDETQPVTIPLAPAAMMANAVSDLDLPAFMRRRERYSTES